jgi:hypothetical protein
LNVSLFALSSSWVSLNDSCLAEGTVSPLRNQEWLPHSPSAKADFIPTFFNGMLKLERRFRIEVSQVGKQDHFTRQDLVITVE